MRSSDITTGTIAGHTVQFAAHHREWNDTPVLFHATMTLPLSLEDIVAALWVAVAGGFTLAEIDTDPASRFSPHALVLETLLADASNVDGARYTIKEMRPGTPEHALLTLVRELAVATFLHDGIPGRAAFEFEFECVGDVA